MIGATIKYFTSIIIYLHLYLYIYTYIYTLLGVTIEVVSCRSILHDTTCHAACRPHDARITHPTTRTKSAFI